MKAFYDQVFITDSKDVRKWASTETDCFTLLKHFHKSNYFRCLFDGPLTFNPTWESVLTVDKIVERNEPIYIEDTLILNCQIDSYCKLIPLIRGRYSRLILHGKITWAQVKELITADVKQVRINAQFTDRMNPTEYDSCVHYIVERIRGRGHDYKFSIAHEANMPAELEQKLRQHLEKGLLFGVLNCLRGIHIIHMSSCALYFLKLGLLAGIPMVLYLLLGYFDLPLTGYVKNAVYLGLFFASFLTKATVCDKTTDVMNDNFKKPLTSLL